MPSGIYIRKPFTEEHRKKISEWQRGKTLSEEHRKKLSEAHKGKKQTVEHKENSRIASKKLWSTPEYRKKMKDSLPAGEKHWQWKGDCVGYNGLHKWIYRKLGCPTRCESCGKSGLTGKQIHWANKSQQYKREVSDWIRLCVQLE